LGVTHLKIVIPLSRQSPCQGTLQVPPCTLNGFIPEADVPDKETAGTPEEGETYFTGIARVERLAWAMPDENTGAVTWGPG
jgi:hypothetical protein